MAPTMPEWPAVRSHSAIVLPSFRKGRVLNVMHLRPAQERAMPYPQVDSFGEFLIGVVGVIVILAFIGIVAGLSKSKRPKK